MLSRKQIKDVLKLFDLSEIIFITTELGEEVLSEVDKFILKQNGIDLKKIPKKKLVEYVFQLGMLSKTLSQRKLKDLTFRELLSIISSGKFVPLSAVELGAIESTKNILYNEIKGLGNKIKGDFSRVLIEADAKQRLRTEKLIEEKTKETILDRKSISWLASQLGEKTGDWARDFDRIADYNMHYAFNNGAVYEMLKGGKKAKEVEVYFDVFDSACPHCIELYLMNGLGSEPKIFKLDEILNNGTNIGRKAKDWKATVPPIHPWCRCQIREKPENSIWDKNKRRWKIIRTIPKHKSRVKITISR